MAGSILLSPALSSSHWDKELAIVQELLQGEADCRLVTLVSPARTGAAWLACRATRRLRSAFRDGAYVIRLTTLQSVDLFPAAIAAGVGLCLPGQEAPGAGLLDGLCEKEMLLTLDGFCRFLEWTTLVDDLLLGAPRIKLLITSPVRLNLRAEWVRQTAGLGPLFARKMAWRMHPLDRGGARDAVMSSVQADRERLAQASSMASSAGW